MADDQALTSATDTTAAPPIAPDPVAAPDTSGDQTAPSPSATPEPPQGDTRSELLSAVQQAVPELRTSQDGEAGQGGVSPAPAKEADPSAPPPSPDQLPDDPTAEELARYHPSAKARVDKLIAQRRELKGEVERLRGVEPQAQAAASVQKYLADNDISRDDFLLPLELASAMRRGDFEAFYTGVKPYVQLAEEYLGIALPADLQAAVQQGQMTTQAAARFSRERMDRGLAQSRNMRTQQIYTEQTQTAQQQQVASHIFNTVQAWEAQKQRTDPDYAVKEPLLRDVIGSVINEKGRPQSAEQAVELANEAYRRAGMHAQKLAAQRRAPTSRVPSSTGRSNGAAPEPKSLREAVVQAMERARSA